MSSTESIPGGNWIEVRSGAGGWRLGCQLGRPCRSPPLLGLPARGWLMSSIRVVPRKRAFVP